MVVHCRLNTKSDHQYVGTYIRLIEEPCEPCEQEEFITGIFPVEVVLLNKSGDHGDKNANLLINL